MRHVFVFSILIKRVIETFIQILLKILLSKIKRIYVKTGTISKCEKRLKQIGQGTRELDNQVNKLVDKLRGCFTGYKYHSGNLQILPRTS